MKFWLKQEQIQKVFAAMDSTLEILLSLGTYYLQMDTGKPGVKLYKEGDGAQENRIQLYILYYIFIIGVPAEGGIRVLGKEAFCRGLWEISCLDEGQKAEGVCFRENFGPHFNLSCYFTAKSVHWTICHKVGYCNVLHIQVISHTYLLLLNQRSETLN